MKVPVSLKIRATLILLTVSVMLQAVALFPFSSVDSIVNYELYKYGLQFDPAWYNLYQNHVILFLIGLVVSIIFIVLSIVGVLHFLRNNRASLGLVEYLFPLVIVGINIFSIFNFASLTHLVHTDFYNYGLQFSFEWATPLLTYTTIILTLAVLTCAAMITTSFLIHFSAREVITANSLKSRTETIQIQSTELTSFVLITAGTAALLTSVFSASSILAFIGIGLIFWGILFRYIRKEEYTKSKIVDAVANQQIVTLNQMIDELNFQGNPLYLPPKYFTNPENLKVYIPKSSETELPTPEQIQNQESRIFVRKPKGILVTPPGLELVRLLEKNIATDLTRVDLQYLQLNMPKTFVEDLEVAKNLEIENENKQISVKIEYFADRKRDGGKDKKEGETPSAMESILSSAIACALAKTTGRPIIIIEKETSNNGKNEIIRYQIITEEAERQP
jgi:hypothetical protein